MDVTQHRVGRRSLSGLHLMSVASAALLLALLGASSAAAAGTTPAVLHVSPHGNDASSGTSAAPLRTISAAVNRAPADGTVVVASGSYHENVTILRSTPVHLTSAPGATVWLDGSRVVSGWTASNGRWVAGGWTASFDSSPTLNAGAPDGAPPYWQFVSPSFPMAAHPDQVWIDNDAQRQVGTLAGVRPGTFYVDYTSDKLYLGSSPVGREVRASDLPKAISVRAPGTTIDRINVRRYAPSVPTMGAVTVERPDVTVSNLKIVDNATSGLQVGTRGARLTNLLLERNGMIGLRANRADNMRLTHVTARDNNREHFNTAPSAGGTKITGSVGVKVRNSTFARNYGTGLWFDASNYQFSVLSSRMRDNSLHGLFLEVSGTGTVANNVISGNRGNGLEINDTDRVQVWNNTFSNNAETIQIAQDWRDVKPSGAYHNPDLPLPWLSRDITLHNNILANPDPDGSCLLCVEDFSHRFSAGQLRIVTDGNVYQRPSRTQPRWLVVWSRGPGDPARYETMLGEGGLRVNTGQERIGRVLNGDPALTDLLKPTSLVKSLVPSTAYPRPRWLAEALGVGTGGRYLGAWLS